MSIGHDFPVVGPGGVRRWWVIPEGFTGQLVSGFSLRGPQLHLYTVKQSTGKPAGAVAGPYANQGDAQAQADKLNAANAATPGNIAQQAAQGTVAGLLQGNDIWIRAGEAIAGLLLLYVGAKAFFPTTVNTVTSTAKKAGKAAAFL